MLEGDACLPASTSLHGSCTESDRIKCVASQETEFKPAATNLAGTKDLKITVHDNTFLDVEEITIICYWLYYHKQLTIQQIKAGFASILSQ